MLVISFSQWSIKLSYIRFVRFLLSIIEQFFINLGNYKHSYRKDICLFIHAIQAAMSKHNNVGVGMV